MVDLNWFEEELFNREEPLWHKLLKAGCKRGMSFEWKYVNLKKNYKSKGKEQGRYQAHYGLQNRKEDASELILKNKIDICWMQELDK